MSRTIPKLLLIACCILMLNGCTIRIAYNMLDKLLGWQLGQYVTLKGEQKDLAKQTFKEFHHWHRQTQLPLYKEYLENLKAGMLEGDISGAYLHAESDKLQDLIDVSVTQLVPGFTKIAMSLNDEQIQEVVEQLEKERQEYREDYLEDSEEKIQKKRIRDITRYIGGFFGSFTEDQKGMLKTWESTLTPHEELMIAQQGIWQDEFLDAMTLREYPEQLQEKIQSLMLVRTDNWDPELQKVLDINQEQTFDMLADLFNSQSPKQRKKLEKKFDQYIRDLEILSHKTKEEVVAMNDQAQSIN